MQSGSNPTAIEPASLPNLWLHKLGVHVSAELRDDASHRTLLAVFRTCTACRDAVLLSRRAYLHVTVHIRAEDWPAVLRRVCTALRRSRNVKLVLEGPHYCCWHGPAGTRLPDWTQTEPYIIHLLLCARRKLGSAALEGIKEVVLDVSWICASGARR